METMGEKHAFFEKRKCGSRKVLRFMRSLLYALNVLSLPPRGAWIEMWNGVGTLSTTAMSLPPRGAWIEIMGIYINCLSNARRSPHGERGLKFFV